MDLQLPVQPMPITSTVVSSNPAHGDVHSIQHYVIKFDNDLVVFSGYALNTLALISATSGLRYFSTRNSEQRE